MMIAYPWLAVLGVGAMAATMSGRGTARPARSNWPLDKTPLERSAAQLSNNAAEHIAWAGAYRDRIVEVRGARTMENTLVPFNDLLMHLDAAASECNLFARVHPSADVRRVAEESEQMVEKFKTEIRLDRRLFEAAQAIDTTGADAPTRYALFKIIRDLRRAGVDKDDVARKIIRALNEEIVALGQDFARNIREDEREITLRSPSDLDGLPQDWIAKHRPAADGKIRVSTRYPDYYPFMSYATSANARLALYKQFKNRGYPKNGDVLKSLLAKRYELARLLGYRNYADYITEDKMIGSADNARAFIERISTLSKPPVERERQRLLERKRRDFPDATAVEDWERAYYEELIRSEEYESDSQAMRPYFNFADVREGLFQVTGKLFGISYQPVTGLTLWHPDVTAWNVHLGEEFVGRFYLDLHPRADKYGHAAQFDYRTGIKGVRAPQAVLVCNFPNPRDNPEGLALMEHSEVVTFFHEFGHLLHVLLSGHQSWMPNAGIATEWDFVEAPSQMLEEWCFDPSTLRMFARHHGTREPIPVEMVEKLRRARDFGKATWAAHQMFYAAVSLGYYDQDPVAVDLEAQATELQERFSPFPHVPDTHFAYSFGHLDSYSAIYYTYMWSLVIAKDMFSEFEKKGLFDAKTSGRYRQHVLSAGGSAPAAELVQGFLGRPRSFEPFEEWLNRN